MQLFRYVLPVLVAVAPAAAQQTLTKDETINYINTKLAEAVGAYYYAGGGAPPQWLASAKVSLAGSRLTLSYVTKEPESDPGPPDNDNFVVTDRTRTFSPALISGITLRQDGGTANQVVLSFPSPNVRLENIHRAWLPRPGRYPPKEWGIFKRTLADDTFVWIPFLASDPQNFDRLKKAFLHLQALMKAEDDPFGSDE